MCVYFYAEIASFSGLSSFNTTLGVGALVINATVSNGTSPFQCVVSVSQSTILNLTSYGENPARVCSGTIIPISVGTSDITFTVIDNSNVVTTSSISIIVNSK